VENISNIVWLTLYYHVAVAAEIVGMFVGAAGLVGLKVKV
jgi:hypothetical protein